MRAPGGCVLWLQWLLLHFLTVVLLGSGVSVTASPAVGVTATWIAGSNLTNQPDVLAPAVLAAPGARTWHCSAVVGSTLYLHGGVTFTGADDVLGDFWSMDLVALQWRQLKASTPANYSTIGVALPANYPGYLRRHTCTVSPADKQLYLFGGAIFNMSLSGSRYLWRYNASTGLWVWLGGQSGPLGRYNHAMAAHPILPLIYIMGGATSIGAMNDLWQYHGTKLLWTLLSGNDTTPRTMGVYGVLGVNNVSNCPSARTGFTMAVVSPSNGTYQLLMYGGFGSTTDNTQTSFLSDLWSFDLSTGQGWVWLDGSNKAINVQSKKGVSGVFDDMAYPGSRSGATLDNWPGEALVFLFGGRGAGAQNNINYLSDIWLYNATSKQWSWLNGDVSPYWNGNYGTLNSTSADSAPPPRQFHSTGTYTSNSRQLLVLGGKTGILSDMTYLNDVWLFNFTNLNLPDPIQTSLDIALAALTSTKTSSSVTQLTTTSATTTSTVSFSTTLKSTTSATASRTSPATASPSSSQTGSATSSTIATSTLLSTSLKSKPSSTVKTSSPFTLSVSPSYPTSSSSSSSIVSSSTTASFEETDATSSTVLLQESTDVVAPTTDNSNEFTSSTEETDSTITATISLIESPTSLGGVQANSGQASDKTPSSLIFILIAVGLLIIAAVIAIRMIKLNGLPAPLNWGRRSLSKRNKGAFRSSVVLMELARSNDELAGGSARRTPADVSEADLYQEQGPTEMSMVVTSYSEQANRTVMQSGAAEISVPGFLEMAENRDFVVAKVAPVGQGAHGSILKGRLLSKDAVTRAGTTICIVKRIKFSEPDKSTADSTRADEMCSFNQEVAMMYYLRQNVNIAKLIGFCMAPPSILMVSYDLGSLADFLFEPQSLSNTKLASLKYDYALVTALAGDILTGLEAIHDAGFAHLDIKPANILLEEAPNTRSPEQQWDDVAANIAVAVSAPIRAVLADFGISRIVADTALQVSAFQKSKLCGASIAYAAPDLIRILMEPSEVRDGRDDEVIDSASQHGRRYTRRQERWQLADCYAFGITLFEMVTRSAAWGTLGAEDIMERVFQDQRPRWPDTLVLQRTEQSVVGGLMRVAEQCWRADARQRPDAKTARLAIFRLPV